MAIARLTSADGICDDVDDCVGELDACGVCNGPGAIYECGCSDIPAGDCDCDGNQLDALGVCGVIAQKMPMRMASAMMWMTALASSMLAACATAQEIFECGCEDIPAGDCDCDGNQLDALGVCGGDCAEDADADGICDNVDDCVGELDACGVCNGPGEIYECGCADIPEGDCDCDGNQLDALGVCGGDCTEDADMDGICDNVDPVIGGCSNPCACNYMSDAAVINDASCVFDGCSGCIYATATNYDETAIFDDNSCIWEGCMDPTFLNYNPYATVDAMCTNVPSSIDFNNDGDNDVFDLITFLQFYGLGGEDLDGENATVGEACATAGMSVDELTQTTGCEGCCPSGCSYESAMNYDPMANQDSGSCVFGGCTNAEANNFNPLANVDDDSCRYGICPDFDGNGEVNLLDLLALLLGIGN